jgi:hypothetical protein
MMNVDHARRRVLAHSRTSDEFIESESERQRKWPGSGPAIVASNMLRCYCACAFAAAMSASLRNDITVTLRVRNDGSTTFIWPSFSYSET